MNKNFETKNRIRWMSSSWLICTTYTTSFNDYYLRTTHQLKSVHCIT